MEDWVHVNETDSHEGGGDFLIRTLVYLQSGAMSGLNDCLHPSRHPSQTATCSRFQTTTPCACASRCRRAPEHPATAEAGGAGVGGLVDERGQRQEGHQVGQGEVIGVGHQGHPIPGTLLRDVRLAGAAMALM